MVLLFLLSLLVLGAINVLVTHQLVVSEKKAKTRQLVEVALSLVGHFSEQQRKGLLSEAEAQARSVAAIRDLRYDTSEYFWITSLDDARVIMHPQSPALEGQRIDASPSGSVIRIEPDIAVSVPEGNIGLGDAMVWLARAGGGYLEYLWPKPRIESVADSRHYPKISYVRGFEPWHWTLGSGIYIDDVDALASNVALRNLLLIFVVGGVFVGMSALLARSVLNPLHESTRLIAARIDSGGQLGVLPIARDDEVGALLQMFNQLQVRLHEREEKLLLAANVFDHAREAIMVTTPEARIIDVNAAFTRITGYSRDEVCGQTPRIFSSGRHDKGFYAAMWEAILHDGEWQGEIWNRRRNGEVYPEQLTVSVVRDSQDKPLQYVAIFTDITERKQMEEKVERMAYYDPLTDLPNRRLLQDRLQQAMALTQRTRHHGALMVLDLDNFKPLNDNHGHELGDYLLIEVARRLRECIRASDTVARLGGDEFVVLLADLALDKEKARNFASTVADKILDSLAQPYVLTGAGHLDSPVEHRCSASMGVHLFMDHENSHEEIIKGADLAMYRAKEAGRGTTRFSDD